MYRVIFEHTPKKGQEAQFIEAWQKGSAIMQTYPGALGSTLFRSEINTNVFLAITDWVSKTDRDNAVLEVEKLPNSADILRGHEDFIEQVKIIGGMELVAKSDPKTE